MNGMNVNNTHRTQFLVLKNEIQATPVSYPSVFRHARTFAHNTTVISFLGDDLRGILNIIQPNEVYNNFILRIHVYYYACWVFSEFWFNTCVLA